MIPRKRYGSKNTDQGVYLGLSKTQVLSPATAVSSSSDITPLSTPVALVPSPPDTMSCRDRTQEFLSACKSLQSRQNGIQTNKPALRAARQRSEFTLMAKRIGKDLSNTFAKLEKLTILAKRKSLFDDKAVEIEELTYIIKQDINSLNKQIAQLQDFVKAKGSQSGRHLQTHSNTIVVSLQSKLASMSNDFKSVLEVRTENLKQQRSRREQFSRAPVSALPLAPNHLGGGPIVLGAESRASRDVAIDMMDSRTSQQLQLIDEQDSYIQSRADTMQNIESTIVELGSIFQQLAHMVKEQEETIQRLSGRLFHEAGTLQDCPILFFSSSAVTFLWVLHVQFMQHTVKQSRQEQYLVQMAISAMLKANSIMRFFLVPIFLSEVNWYCQEQLCLTVMKNPNKPF